MTYLSKQCHQLDDWERCTSLKHLYLSSEGLHSGQKGYIVCGTAYCYGEDITPRGYIRIYAVIDVIPEPGQPLTKNKIKPVYEKEQKGPITALSAGTCKVSRFAGKLRQSGVSFILKS